MTKAEQVTTVPNEGDRVLIELDGQQWEAVVGQKAPRGDFTVSWYAGQNPSAPWLCGHWYAGFYADGSPKNNWRIAAILSGNEGVTPDD